MTGKPEMSTKLIADAGIFAALSIVLLLLALYVPFLGLFATFVWSVPLMIVVLRHHWWAGVLSGIVIFLGAMVLAGPVSGFLAALTIVGFGLTYGLCFQHRVSPAKTFFLGTVITGLITGSTILVMTFLGNVPFTELLNQAEAAISQVLSSYESMGLLDNLLPAGMTAEEYSAQILAVFRMLLPAAFILAAMTTAAANYIFAGVILKRLNFYVRTLPPFREWHVPWWMVWGVIIALISLFLGNRLENENLLIVTQNIFYIYIPIALISGLSLLAFLLHQYHVSRNVQIIFWILFALFMTFSLPFTLFLGLFDMVIDYRKIFAGMKKRKDNKDK